jgi:hypothetical protein
MQKILTGKDREKPGVESSDAGKQEGVVAGR